MIPIPKLAITPETTTFIDTRALSANPFGDGALVNVRAYCATLVQIETGITHALVGSFRVQATTVLAHPFDLTLVHVIAVLLETSSHWT